MSWWDIQIIFTGKKEHLSKLYTEIDASREAGGKSNYGVTWLGNLLLHIGMSNIEILNYHANGRIVYDNYTEGCRQFFLLIESEDPPPLDVFHAFLKHFNLDKIDTSYAADNHKESIFVTDLMNLKGCWRVEAENPNRKLDAWGFPFRDIFPERLLKKRLLQALHKRWGKTKNLVREFMDQYEDVSIHPYVYCPAEVWK